MARRTLAALAAFALVISSFGLSGSRALALAPNGPSPSVVISQIYGGGGNSGAVYTNDFVELFNRGSAPVSIEGWSLQYASSSGTGNFGSATNFITPLSGTIPSGGYRLVQEAAGSTPVTPLPGPDVTDPSPINMAGTGGKVALVNTTTPLGCNGGSTPCSSAALATIVDLVGWDGANFYEGAGAAPTTTNGTAVLRGDGGCADTDNNGADFTALTPSPRNSSSPLHFCQADIAPSVISRTPASGASNVALASAITIGFSEAVNVASGWYGISCTASGAHTATVTTADSITFVLDPDTDFVGNEDCTVTVFASQVTDTDANDPPDAMSANSTWTFTTVDPSLCGDPATRIHDIQGSALASPIVGTKATIEGVVVGDYQGPGQFDGYYVQEEDSDADADPATSEGIFVFSTSSYLDVSAGDVVRIRGKVTEYTTSSGGVSSKLTELGSVTRVTVCSSGAAVTPTMVTLPVSSYTDFERYEGMLVHFTQQLTATETYTLARYGEVRLAADGRLYTPTAVTTPGAAAIALEDANMRRSFVLDDGNNSQNIDPTLYPAGGLSATNTLRSGYTVGDLTGVFDHRFGVYRLQPVVDVPFAATNPRPEAPAAVGGNTKVASMNVLNYFTTLDQGSGHWICGPSGTMECRGADSAFEVERQRNKIISALEGLDADVVGLMEIENNASAAVADLVASLNTAGAGPYSFIDTGTIGTDAIKVALIYKTATVTPVGSWKTIDSTVDPRFIDTKNRPSLAQTFQRNGTTEKVTVVVNHLKSKGFGCEDLGDVDLGDGQGPCNITRTRAAAAIVDWLATDPTASGSPNSLLIGDMNSYTFEDPITTFTSGGFTNLVRWFGGLGAYSYVFNGESGYLDQALGSAALASHVTGAIDWHINADEPIGLDYNVEYKSPNQVNTFYDASPYRSSDHDPVVVGIDLRTTAATLCAFTRTVVTKADLAGSLCTKLDASAAAGARGNAKAHDNQIQAYINEVNAQRGKAISNADANTLVALAGTI